MSKAHGRVVLDRRLRDAPEGLEVGSEVVDPVALVRCDSVLRPLGGEGYQPLRDEIREIGTARGTDGYAPAVRYFFEDASSDALSFSAISRSRGSLDLYHLPYIVRDVNAWSAEADRLLFREWAGPTNFDRRNGDFFDPRNGKVYHNVGAMVDVFTDAEGNLWFRDARTDDFSMLQAAATVITKKKKYIYI